MSGKIYDTEEEKTMQALVDKQTAIFRQEESSDDVMKGKVIQYSILGVSAILALVIFKYFVTKKNK
jgi:hypothetical protein